MFDDGKMIYMPEKEISRIRRLLSGGDTTPAFAGSTVSESQALRSRALIAPKEADASTTPLFDGTIANIRLSILEMQVTLKIIYWLIW